MKIIYKMLIISVLIMKKNCTPKNLNFAPPIFCPYCVFIVQNVYLYHRTHKNTVTGLFWGLFLNFRNIALPFCVHGRDTFILAVYYLESVLI